MSLFCAAAMMTFHCFHGDKMASEAWWTDTRPAVSTNKSFAAAQKPLAAIRGQSGAGKARKSLQMESI